MPADTNPGPPMIMGAGPLIRNRGCWPGCGTPCARIPTRRLCEIIVSPDITAIQAHQVAVSAKHALLHAIPRLAAALVHADPEPCDGTGHLDVLASHR